MKIKSYFANSVEDAMASARQELGPDAMLVNSRKSSPEARHLGAYEVVFVTEAPEPDAPSAPTPAQNDRLAQEMAEVKKELEGMRRTITRQASASSAWGGSTSDQSDSTSDRSAAYEALTASEVSPELAREIVEAAEARARLSPRQRTAESRLADLRTALAQELESRYKVQAVLGRGEAHPRIVALIGPPGAGKTTTLVKLAVNYGLAARRPAILLSIDTYRVAAAEQLRSYSAILGMGFQLVETVTALAQAIEEHRSKDLIFLDTPGLALAELANHAGLAQFLSTREDIDTQMVVSSSMKSADLSRVVDGYEVFRPQRLIFTKLDETGSFGPILNEAARTGKPLSFFTAGQRIPEDLEAVTTGRVAELILGRSGGRALSAA